MATDRKLDIFKNLLTEIDKGNINYYEKLSDDEKKEFSPLIIMRYLSSSENNNNISPYQIKVINEFVNKHFFSISSHHELIYKLMSGISLGKKIFHPWIPMSKKFKHKEKLCKLIILSYPDANDDEIDLILSQLDIENLKDMCVDSGMDDTEIKEIIKLFKEYKKE